jgi:predicted secreted hydrolase
MSDVKVLTALFVAALLAGGCSPPASEPDPAIGVDQAMGGAADPGFARALTPRPFRFPLDHGPHPEFQNEWWYFTGNLADARGRRFGYQVTLFRIALRPSAPSRASSWGTRQVWMGHVALTDVNGERHLASERVVRDALGLAGASLDPLRLWVEDWRVARDPDTRTWRLAVAAEGFALALELAERRPPLPQGDQGLSQKSAEPGNASHYYSITRLETRGEIRLNGEAFGVQGWSWLDREWSTSALGPDQSGWDWFSMQFEDGTDLMYYQLRRTNGEPDPHSAGSVVTPDGGRIDLSPDDLELAPLAWWEGPDGGRYPIAWEMHILPLDRRVRIRALLPDQLMELSVRYWEGAIRLQDPNGRHLGYGYLEMTGYASP